MSITGNVRGELECPVIRIVPRTPAVRWTAVPEAPVHKHRKLPAPKDNVWSNAGVSETYQGILSVTESPAMQLTSKAQLCVRVRLAVSLGPPARASPIGYRSRDSHLPAARSFELAHAQI